MHREGHSRASRAKHGLKGELRWRSLLGRAALRRLRIFPRDPRCEARHDIELPAHKDARGHKLDAEKEDHETSTDRDEEPLREHHLCCVAMERKED